jgi:sec-independent protein translocase protein TatA
MNVMIAAFLGGWEWIIVILAVLLLFGSKKIPELARGLGTGIKEFKKVTREVTDEIHNAGNEKSATSKPAATNPAARQPAQVLTASPAMGDDNEPAPRRG